jgi:geranylgeranylglycerol-phosphate geranylgeranyltransferase
MKRILPFLNILRIHNTLIASLAVLLGYWLSGAVFSSSDLLLLFLTTIAATGFGNVINDIKDIESDKISHPERPLPSGLITTKNAWIYCFLLSLTALVSSFSVSKTHGFATFLPLLLLIVYSLFLKGTPIIGNVIVAILVAYSILFGALTEPGFRTLVLPAFFAFLLNLSREIIKDIQDEPGDRAAFVLTSAILPKKLLRTIIYVCSVIYLSTLFIPYVTGSFGIPYFLICLIVVLPLHIYRSILLVSNQWKLNIPCISKLFKVEMVCGLSAIAIDRLIR